MVLLRLMRPVVSFVILGPLSIKMDMLELAKRRAAELEAELKELHAFMRTYEKLAPLADGPSTPVTAVPKAPSKRQRIEDATADALTQNQPLKVPEILRILTDAGIDVGGNDPERYLSSYLSRSERFENRRKDGGWFLVRTKKRVPEGGNLAGTH